MSDTVSAVPAAAGNTVRDPARLEAVRRTGLLDTPQEEVFDRLTRLAARVIEAPVTFISLVDENRDFYKSCHGFGEPLATVRQLEGTTFCHYAIQSDQPLVIPDTRADPVYRQVPTVESLGVAAYLGIPLVTSEGHAIGSFCAIDFQPRDWSPEDVELLREMAASAMREIELRDTVQQVELHAAELQKVQHYHDLVESLDAIVWEMDVATWLFTYVSPQAETLLGHPRERWYEPGFWAEHLVHPDDREWAVPYCTEATEQGQDHRFDYRAIASDGRTVWLRDVVRVVSGPDGKPRLLRGVMFDITSQKQAADAADEIHRQQQMLLATAGEGIYGLDAEGRTTFINPAAARILGWEPEELIGRPQHDLIHHSHADGSPYDRSDCPIHASLRDGKVHQVAEEVFWRKDGTSVPVSYTSAPLAEKGRVVGAVVTFRDVTEQKAAVERELQLAQERVARAESESARQRVFSILESITDAFFAVDGQWRFTYVNNQAERLLQRSKDELLGRSIWEEFPEAVGSTFHRQYQLAVEERRTVEFQEFYPPLNAWFDVRAFPSERGLSVYFRDVTEQRQAQEALRQQSELTRTVLNNATSAIFMMDERGRTTYMNSAAEQMIGFTQEEIADVPLHDAIHHHHPDGTPYPISECPIDRALPEDFSIRAHEDVFIRKDGTYFPVLCAASPIFNDEGVPVGTVVEVRDVTEERRAAAERERLIAALDNERRRLSELFRQAPAFIATLRGPDHVFESANPAYLQLVGHRPVLGQPVREALPEVVEQGFVELLDGVYRTGEPFSGNEVPVRLQLVPGGPLEERFVNFVYQPMTGPDGASEGIFVHGVDVTEQVRARQGVEQLEERLRLALASADVGTWDLDLRTNVLVWDQRTRRAFGVDDDVPIDYDLFVQRVHPEDREQADQQVQQALDPSGGGEFETEYRVILPSGTVRWIRAKGKALFQGEGESRQAVRFLGTIIDVTEQKQAEQERERLIAALDAERARLRRLFDQAPAVIAMYNGPEHVITVTNPAYEQVVGRTNLIGRSFREVFPELEGSGLFELLDQVYQTGEPYIANELQVFLDRNGDGKLEESYWNFVWQPLADHDGKVTDIFVHAVEVSSQVRARHEVEQKAEELRRLTRVLEITNRELDQFAYVASHDLKAPLRGIANLSQWIEEDLDGEINDEVREHLDMLRGRVHRMEGLIDGILQYSRAGRVRERPEPVDVRALLGDVIELLAPPKEVEIRVADGMPTLNTERLPLQQVLMNLIGNAVKYSRDAGARVEVTVADRDQFYEFAVSDNGPGIAPEYHDRIFGIFQTLEARDKVEGTGIGLSLVKKIVENRGGRVWVESELGSGSTFRFLWPKETQAED